MTTLELLKKATSLSSTARILGVKPAMLSYILYKKNKDSLYTQFSIPKKTGGLRTISAPVRELKLLQTRVKLIFENAIENNSMAFSHGFKKNHSIITNATPHRNKRYVFNADISDFFGSINFGRVRGFLIKNRNFEFHPAVATVIAQIACHDNKLPQGSPCSPIISNLISQTLDIRLSGLAKTTGCIYTRYADDITFSTNKKSPSSRIFYHDPALLHKSHPLVG